MKRILNKISNEGLILEVENGELQIFSTKEEVDQQLVSEIKSHKKELVAYLVKHKKSTPQNEKYREIPQCPPQESYPLSNAQLRLWVASQFEGGSVAYNIPNSIIWDGAIDITAFEKAINSVIKRHETYCL